MGSSVAIRLGTTGKADVQADFAAIADSGDASAKRLAASYQRAGDDIAAATKRQADAAAKISAVMPSSTQATVNASVGTGYNGSQNANAAQFTALLAQQERQVAAVRAQIDPLYTAQKRYDSEVGIAAGLLKTGAISEAEHAASLAASGRAFQAAKNAVEQHTGAIGLNRQQTIIAQSAVLRFTDAVIAGRNPLTALALEAHKGVEVLSTDEGGMAGGLAKVAAFINPVSVGIGALTAVVALGGIAWVQYVDAIGKLNGLAVGAGAVIGATGDQLEANAEAASRSSTETVGGARDIESAYVKLGGIGADVLEPLTAMTADFAAATGNDAAQAAQILGKALQEPVKGAEELAARYGSLNQVQVEEIKHMADAGDLYGAQRKLLDDLANSVHGAAEQVHGLGLAWQETKKFASEAMSSLGQVVNDQGPGWIFALTGVPLPGTFGDGKGPPPKAVPHAASNSFVESALDATNQYTGRGEKEQLEARRSTVERALANPQGAKPEDLATLKTQYEALTHAIDTFTTVQQKQIDVDRAEATLAQARTPQARAAAAAALARAQAEGRVVTASQLSAEADAKGEQARARLDKAADKHGATLAREADAMEASTRAALDAATAYLKGSAAGEEAEARQKAAGDATKKGIDQEAQYQRQLAENVANAIKNGAKASAQLDDETAARNRVLTALAAGTIGYGQMNDAMSDDAKLRPLINAQTNATGEAAKKAAEAIAALTKSMNDNHAAQQRLAATSDAHSIDNGIAGLHDQAELTDKRNPDNAIELARRAAERDAAERYPDLKPDDPKRQAVVNGRVTEARAKQTTDTATYTQDTLASQKDAMTISQQQLGLVTANANQRERTLALVQKEVELSGRLIPLDSQQAVEILAGVDAQTKMNEKIAQGEAAMNDLRQTGDQFIDNLFNPKAGTLKSELKLIEQELLKMAAINPIKNALLGENNPTLGGLLGGAKSGGGGKGIGGFLGWLFGSAVKALGGGGGIDVAGNEAGANSAIASILGSLHGFASGTESAAAGPAWVGEQGPELVNLPQGAKVTNAADTRRMMNAQSEPQQVVVHVQANDYFDAKVHTISGAHVQAATPSIISAAHQRTTEHYARQSRYSLGRS